MKDYYKILQISRDADNEIVNAAVRVFSKKYHPDLHPGEEDKYKDLMLEVNEAKETLMNPLKRKEYDRQLLEEKQENIRRSEDLQAVDIPRKPTKPPISSDEKKLVFKIFIGFVAFAAIFITAGILILNSLTAQTGKNISLGMNSNSVLNILGEPNEKHSDIWIYDDYQILFEQGSVSGWINPYSSLPLSEHKDVKNVRVGDDKYQLLRKVGNPDTLTEELMIYNDVVIYLNDETVTRVTRIK